MRAEFTSTLRHLRGQIFGWGLALFLLSLLLIPFYKSIGENQSQLMAYMESFPKEFTAFFGDMTKMGTPQGYLNIEYFSYMPLLLGIFAVLAGSGLIVSDEEAGRLDVIAAQPISRTSFFLSRLLAFITAAFGIVLLGWLGMVIPLGGSGMDVTAGELILPFIPVLAHVFLFGALALLLSMLLPSRNLAASVSGLLLVADFFIQGFSNVIKELEPVSKILPSHYYQGGYAMDGLDLPPLLVILAIAAALALVAMWRYQARDLRVGGEGGWGLAWLRRRVLKAGSST
ncbi:MAG: ABC transporter permease subunit [Anaerolineales bacterium]|jgi:ABC-2 type transport system permease protein